MTALTTKSPLGDFVEKEEEIGRRRLHSNTIIITALIKLSNADSKKHSHHSFTQIQLPVPTYHSPMHRLKTES